MRNHSHLSETAISRFSEDVDLTYDIRALAPELVRGAAGGIDAIPPIRSQEKKWSDEIRRELLPAWIRNRAHPFIQTGLERLENVSSRITEDCIFSTTSRWHRRQATHSRL